MAWIRGESFDHFAIADLLQWFTQLAATPSAAPTISAGNGRRSTASLRWAPASAGFEGQSLYLFCGDPIADAPSGGVCIVGFAFKHGGLGFTALNASTSGDPNEAPASGTLGTPALLYIQESGTTHVFFRLNTTGTISAYRGDGTLLGTTTLALQQGVYAYLEFKVTVHNSTGTVAIRKDGMSMGLTLTGQDTQNGGSAAWNTIAIGHTSTFQGSPLTWDYDDLYICDGSGSVCNDFLGDVRADDVFPTGNGATRNFTPSTGTNDYAVVDEASANGDTDYLTGAVAGDRVSLAFPDSPAPGADIVCLQLACQGKKTDSGTATHKGLTRIGGTEYVGKEVAMPAGYGGLIQSWPVKPSDSAVWAESEFNAAEFGAEKTT